MVSRREKNGGEKKKIVWEKKNLELFFLNGLWKNYNFATNFCDDLSGRVRGTSSYLVSNPISSGWWRKNLKGKRLPSIKIEAFSERLAKGFLGTPKLSMLQWEQSQDG